MQTALQKLQLNPGPNQINSACLTSFYCLSTAASLFAEPLTLTPVDYRSISYFDQGDNRPFLFSKKPVNYGMWWIESSVTDSQIGGRPNFYLPLFSVNLPEGLFRLKETGVWFIFPDSGNPASDIFDNLSEGRLTLIIGRHSQIQQWPINGIVSGNSFQQSFTVTAAEISGAPGTLEGPLEIVLNYPPEIDNKIKLDTPGYGIGLIRLCPDSCFLNHDTFHVSVAFDLNPDLQPVILQGTNQSFKIAVHSDQGTTSTADDQNGIIPDAAYPAEGLGISHLIFDEHRGIRGIELLPENMVRLHFGDSPSSAGLKIQNSPDAVNFRTVGTIGAGQTSVVVPKPESARGFFRLISPAP